MNWKEDHEKVQPVLADIGGNTMFCVPKRFSTGSLGWYGQGKGTIDDTRVQISIVVTVIGSKNAPERESASEQMNKRPGKGSRKPVNQSGSEKDGGHEKTAPK